MTTISGTIPSPSPTQASPQKPLADASTQSAGVATSSASKATGPLVLSNSASYSDAGQAIVNLLLDQQDNSATASAGSSPSNTGTAQKPAGAAPASGGSSSSSTKTVTEAEPDGEEIALTEDEKGKVISEKIIKAASQTDISSTRKT